MELDKTGENKPERDEHGRLLPGNTANPNGRPKGTLSLVKILKDELERVPDGEKLSYAEAFIKKIIKQALMDGDQHSQRLIMNYIEGLPKQPVELDMDKNSLAELTHFFREIAIIKKDEPTGPAGV